MNSVTVLTGPQPCDAGRTCPSDAQIGRYVRVPVEVHEADPRAPEAASCLIALIATKWPGTPAEHVGSSAVAGLAGKNTIDLLLAAEPAHIPAITQILLELGFQPQIPAAFPATRPMLWGAFRHGPTDYRVHVHVVPASSPEVAAMRGFRDALRADPLLRRQYGALKRAIVEGGPIDPVAFTKAKHDWITATLSQLGLVSHPQHRLYEDDPQGGGRPWCCGYSSLMKAAVHTRYGPPDVVRILEVDKPAAKDNEVLVKVHATTVNRTDSGLRAAEPFVNRFFTGLRRPRVTVLGNEFAGDVEAAGRGVRSFAVGDRVFGYNGTRFGAHAEYLAMPEDGSLATMPANLTYEQAAASTEGSHYALSMIRKAKIQHGQDVLVYGATGAIGSAAVQLLKHLGAEVTAVCGTEHLELVRGLGADRVIDYTAEDFTNDAQRYDVVLDAVGKSSFGRCKRLLKPGGIYLSSDLGPLSQNPILALITPLLRGKQVMFPIPRDNQEMVRYFKELLESGEFKPLIDRRYRLDEIVEAYRYVETGQKVGNVVISVEPSTS